jgi:hypothetical protein
MKLNRWTLALAAAGIVTAPSLLQAQTNMIMTALSSTTLSGYVDTSAQWNFGTGDVNLPNYAFGGGSKADGFNLDVVDIALDHPEDESPWAAGYHVELWMGPDAASLGTTISSGTDIVNGNTVASSSPFAIQQAYVTLRTPVGNGIDWKMGVFNTIIGYEAFNSPLNPNYTRSYGFSIEPGQHTGLLGTYIVNSELTVSAGIANTLAPSIINGRAFQTGNPVTSGNMVESYKTYMGAATYTVSTNAGWLSGSTFSGGIVNGFNGTQPNTTGGVGIKQTSAYAGATINTPVNNLKVGGSLDLAYQHDPVAIAGDNGRTWAWDIYTSYQATEKLSLNLRGELVNVSSPVLDTATQVFDNNHIYAVTATASYSLWKNVISRAEFRWDHVEHGVAFGGSVNGAAPELANAFMLAANIIYQF